MFWNDLRITEQRISLKNKFWNDLRTIEQKFILEVPGRTKDTFLKQKYAWPQVQVYRVWKFSKLKD
jgi:hypothetical protein